jgi:hypothetical protein
MRYHHLNPSGIDAHPPRTTRRKILAPQDVTDWQRETRQLLDEESRLTVTFIIDSSGCLWIADRHSEHYACASGGAVLSAGEMTFEIVNGTVGVVEATNQSLGYCPEPESWPEVAAALGKSAIPHPDDFTSKFVFRRCQQCGEKNLVKDDWFQCAFCDAPLPRRWNFV